MRTLYSRILLSNVLLSGGLAEQLSAEQGEWVWRVEKVLLLQDEDGRVKNGLKHWMQARLMEGRHCSLCVAMMVDVSQSVLLMKNGEYGECEKQIHSAEWNIDSNLCGSPQLRCFLFATHVLTEMVTEKGDVPWNATRTDYFQWLTRLWCELGSSPSRLLRCMAFHSLFLLLRVSTPELHSWVISQIRPFTRLTAILPRLTEEAESWPLLSDTLQQQLQLAVEASFFDAPSEEEVQPMCLYFPPSASLLVNLNTLSYPCTLECWVKVAPFKSLVLFNSTSQRIRLEAGEKDSILVIVTKNEVARLSTPIQPENWHHFVLCSDSVALVLSSRSLDDRNGRCS